MPAEQEKVMERPPPTQVEESQACRFHAIVWPSLRNVGAFAVSKGRMYFRAGAELQNRFFLHLCQPLQQEHCCGSPVRGQGVRQSSQCPDDARAKATWREINLAFDLSGAPKPYPKWPRTRGRAKGGEEDTGSLARRGRLGVPGALVHCSACGSLLLEGNGLPRVSLFNGGWTERKCSRFLRPPARVPAGQ
eukprot:GHVT01013320.1.p1 GENE.GHVT01013320.1~~GHVT01013320.1.p1  ORF type:complete len:191 (-),score=28.97 GHVT01013320.1:1172-1744(-)